MLAEDTHRAEDAASLADYTHPNLIVPRLREREAAGVIKELAQVLHREGHVPELLPFYNEALNREFLVNTATEAGFAFPHARLSGISHLVFSLGRSLKPLTWGPGSGPQVSFVFLVAVPASDAPGYLQLLSALLRLEANPVMLRRLLQAATVEGIREVLQQASIRNVTAGFSRFV
jgi:mannitol/fructose-specific phosphotransferase system IIA component (Ntr-type)